MSLSQLRYLNAKIFDEDEEILITKHFNLLNSKKLKSNVFDIERMSTCVFLNLPILKDNLINFLNDYYIFQYSNSKDYKIEPISDFELPDYFTLIYILTKANQNEDDLVYYKHNIFYIIYDILNGKIGSFNVNYINFNFTNFIFNFVVRVFIDRHEERETIINNLDEDKLIGFLTNSIFDKKKPTLLDGDILLEKYLLDNFLIKLQNLNTFLKNHFQLHFLGIEYDKSVITSIPLLHETGGSLTTELYLFFCLSNPQIYFKKFGFKLFDSKINGLNVCSSIHSFVGFTGPVAIFIHHWEKQENKEYIFGGFISGNIKEGLCGDEYSFIFTLLPQLKIYKCLDNLDKIVFLQSKNIPPYIKLPGIGLGEYNDKYRFWIDEKNLKNSYFLKFDDVFEEGTPFEEVQMFLNIISIEVIGFGDENDYNELMKKHGKEKILIEKMKKIDKKLVLESEFDKDIFLSETFAHQKYGRKSSLEKN